MKEAHQRQRQEENCNTKYKVVFEIGNRIFVQIVVKMTVTEA